MESSRGKSAGIALENQRILRTHLETPYFCLYTIQQEVCNNCGGKTSGSRTFIKCDVFLGDIFLKQRNICVVGGGGGAFFCNKRLAQRKQFLAGRDLTEEAFKKTSSSMLTREDDYGKHVSCPLSHLLG